MERRSEAERVREIPAALGSESDRGDFAPRLHADWDQIAGTVEIPHVELNFSSRSDRDGLRAARTRREREPAGAQREKIRGSGGGFHGVRFGFTDMRMKSPGNPASGVSAL